MQEACPGRTYVFYRRPLLLRRRARQVIEWLVTLTAAVALSYLILQARW